MKNVMNLTPEEKFNNRVWELLKEIKEKYLTTPKKQPSSPQNEYIHTIKPHGVEIWLNYGSLFNLRKNIIYKLQEWKILKVLDETRGDFNYEGTRFILKILQTKFDEIYRLYESGGSYLEGKKATPETKNSQSIIRPKSLELIAQTIGDLDTGTNLIEFLVNCGVKRALIEYPQTKWRMIYSALLTLASSQNKEDRRTLFKIIEEACHPLMCGGDKILAKKTTDKLNNFLEYDNFFIKDGVLWEGWDDGVGLSWSDKDGNNFEDKLSCLIIPQQMDKLYVYWNELIKLTKFYFNNKNSQDDEINDIYFEIIANVEKLLNGNGCGGLKETYKKPFRNIIGCEFEIQKQGLTTDGLFVNLYDFLGKITELSLPDKNNIERVKKDNSAFFAKVKQYSEQHLTRKEIIQEPPATKIEITKIPELRIKKSEKLSESSRKANKIDYQTSFNEDKSVLSICDKNVKIQKFSDQYHLLRILFKDELKDWQFSEIAELIDSEKAFKWKNLYNSANEIKKKIAIETGIKDFFITTTQSIKINEKYLKKS